MGNIGHWFWHLLRGMAQGCLLLALVALAVSFLGTLVATGHLPNGWELTLILGIAVVSGLLGAVGALAWRLSHIGDIAHAVQDVSEHGVHLP
jgi:hypothetical protein